MVQVDVAAAGGGAVTVMVTSPLEYGMTGVKVTVQSLSATVPTPGELRYAAPSNDQHVMPPVVLELACSVFVTVGPGTVFVTVGTGTGLAVTVCVERSMTVVDVLPQPASARLVAITALAAALFMACSFPGRS